MFDTGWSHWINYLVKEDTMKVAWPGSNEIILVSGMKIVAKSQSDLWRLIMNSSAKFKLVFPNGRKWLTDQRPGNSRAWAEHDQSLSGLWRPIIIRLTANAQKIQKCDGQQADMVIPMSPSKSVCGRKPEKRYIPIYTRLPRSVSVHKVETVEQSKLWSSLGIYVCAEVIDRETGRIMKQSR